MYIYMYMCICICVFGVTCSKKIGYVGRIFFNFSFYKSSVIFWRFLQKKKFRVSTF